MRRRAAIAALALFAVSMASVAFASPDGRNANSSLSASTTGGSFSGKWEWYRNGEMISGYQSNGGWHHWGTLKDTSCDGDLMFEEARVEGYGFAPRRTVPSDCSNKSVDYETYDPQSTFVSYAAWHICRDRGVLHDDNCSALKEFRR
jgi:hypothetical protein